MSFIDKDFTNRDMGRLAKGYGLAWPCGALVFAAYYQLVDFVPPHSPYWIQSPVNTLIEILVLWGLALPVSLALSIPPFLIGCLALSAFHLRRPVYTVIAGALCGRIIYAILPMGGNGAGAAWLAGAVGGLLFWHVAIHERTP